MVRGRVMNVVSTSRTAKGLEVVIGVKVRSMKILKNCLTVQRMRYDESGNLDK